jgi:hypothetical protein
VEKLRCIPTVVVSRDVAQVIGGVCATTVLANLRPKEVVHRLATSRLLIMWVEVGSEGNCKNHLFCAKVTVVHDL